jgi:heme oxygenase (biliverdin-IX-beta and delta-forming)
LEELARSGSDGNVVDVGLEHGAAAPLRPLAARLRDETAEAHAGLEAVTGFSAETMTHTGVVRFLGRLYGFHRVWEPWLANCVAAPEFLAPRSKTGILEQDLRNLGIDAPRKLPLFGGDFGAPAMAGGVGSLYVMEGSTLGGRVIDRWIAGKPWYPPSGIGYFRVYGSDAGTMWRETRTWLSALPVTIHQDVVEAANRTFLQLGQWLGEGRGAA